jgi:hypothetical protein
MISQLLKWYAGYGIGYAILALVTMFQRGWWIERAQRLAAKSDIALPRTMERRVAGFLRAQFLFGQLSLVVGVPPLVTVIDGAIGESIARAERETRSSGTRPPL